MTVPMVKHKVLCYVVREHDLLVFRHLDEPWDESGVQVPAGTIKSGEAPETAALREASEETGLAGLRVVRFLGQTTYDMAPYRDEVHKRHVYLLNIDRETPERWASSEDDPDDGSGTKRFECYWLPLRQAHVLSGGQGALLGKVLR